MRIFLTGATGYIGSAVMDALLICFSGALVTLLLRRRKALAGWVAFVAVASSSVLVLAGVALFTWGEARA